jgi:hypothetical protein
MTPERHLEILRTEGSRLAALPAAALDAPVPTVEGWTLERVVRHVGKVHQWVAAVLAEGPGADVGAVAAGLPGMPKGPDCLPAYAEALQAVAAEIERHHPDDPAATFAGPGTVRFWARRQALEVAVHRIAAGGPEPERVDADAAADGIDEWARLFLATRFAQRGGTFPADLAGRTVHIHGTDDPAPPDGAEWLLTFGSGSDDGGPGVDVQATHAKGDVALRGPAHDLFLTVWRRRPRSSIDAIGDTAVADRLLDVARF